jgi:chemotaxis regulatin CheY-phosphate phosphatase CheZ
MKLGVKRKVLAKMLELVARKIPDAREAVERIISMTTNSTRSTPAMNTPSPSKQRI